MGELLTGRDRWWNLLGIAGLLTVVVGLYMGFIYAPADRVQGDVQRIFYMHVPMAWLAYIAYAALFVGAVGYLWKRDLKWDRLARASAELGFVLTTLVLISGSLWGRPIWGAWWQWEARLTTTLILWFIYLGYFLVRSFAGDVERAARISAVIAIIGAIDIPIIHQSVEWWRTLHPEPIVLDSAGPNLPDSMLAALLVSFAGFLMFAGFLLWMRTRLEYIRDELNERALARELSAQPRPAAQEAGVIEPRQEPVGGLED